MRILYLVRHAKSSWSHPELADRERPLNKRGHASAPMMGQRLHDRGIQLERLITSPALRALTTARYLAEEIDFPADRIETDGLLYFSGVDTMLEIVQQQDPSLNTLMLTGHNPDMTSVLNFLSGYQTDNMPTCAIATIGFDRQWSEVGRGSGQLLDYDFPKKR